MKESLAYVEQKTYVPHSQEVLEHGGGGERGGRAGDRGCLKKKPAALGEILMVLRCN